MSTDLRLLTFNAERPKPARTPEEARIDRILQRLDALKRRRSIHSDALPVGYDYKRAIESIEELLTHVWDA